MGPAEAAEKLQELGEGATGEAAEKAERFRNLCAIYIAVLALLLAVTSLGGGNVVEDMIDANIRVSDHWNFYQAKNIRQTSYEIAADELKLQLQLHGAGMSPATRKAFQAQIAQYGSKIARYESEPDHVAPSDPLKGEGKRELMAQAKDWEKKRDLAMEKDPNFDYAEALLQIAIVLASVAILAMSRPVLLLSLVMGGIGSLLMLNGFTLWFKLPF
jgi:hypothetical protein